MLRRAVRRLAPRSWPSRAALVLATAAVAFDGFLFAEFAASCRDDALDCEPLTAMGILAELAAVGIVVFLVVYVVAVLLRGLARLALRQRAHWRAAGAIGLMLAMFAAGVGAERAGLLGGSPSRADFQIIQQAWGLLHERYVRAADLDSTELAYAAIGAMTEAVGDTDHTSFYTPDEAAALEEELNPTTVTIGAELDVLGDVAVVRSVTPGGPADRAGLLLGDRVLTVDGRSARGLAGAELAGALGEDADSVVTMTVDRLGTVGRFILEIECEEMRLSIVEWSMIPARQVALIWIPEFVEGAADDLAEILDEVAAAEAKGIIVDLRGNPGGLVEEAMRTVSALVASGPVLQVRDADGVTAEVPVDGETIDTMTPLVVLVDADSASASEIVASALQEAGRATLVGTVTSGTGTILEEFLLDDGSALWVGTTEWLTAAGRSVWHKGLTPDIVVAMPDGAEPVRPADLDDSGWKGLRQSGDAQLLRAIQLLLEPEASSAGLLTPGAGAERTGPTSSRGDRPDFVAARESSAGCFGWGLANPVSRRHRSRG